METRQKCNRGLEKTQQYEKTKRQDDIRKTENSERQTRRTPQINKQSMQKLERGKEAQSKQIGKEERFWSSKNTPKNKDTAERHRHTDKLTNTLK